MKKTVLITLIAIISLSLFSCSPAKENNNSSEPIVPSSAEDNNSTEPVAPLFLNEIGKTYETLKAEHPDSTIKGAGIPDADAVCFGDSESDYAYFLYSTQYLPFDDLKDDIKNQLKCAGFATTIGVLFPQSRDNMTVFDFFSAINVKDYDYDTETPILQGWFIFKYNDFNVYIAAISDSFVNGNFTPVQTIKSSYPVVIIDSDTESQNQRLIESSH